MHSSQTNNREEEETLAGWREMLAGRVAVTEQNKETVKGV